jgi:hypothetical protein
MITMQKVPKKPRTSELPNPRRYTTTGAFFPITDLLWSKGISPGVTVAKPIANRPDNSLYSSTDA